MNPNNVVSCIVMGENCENDSLQIAIKCAEDGRLVWVISSRPIIKLPPEIKAPDREVSKLITFIYLKNYTSFIKHLNNAHMWHKSLPNVILISNFEQYSNFSSLNEYSSFNAALAATSALNTASVCAKKNNSQTFLIVFCHSSPVDAVSKERIKIISDLYFQNVLGNDARTILNLLGL